jgi:hypothetical protein
MRGPLKKALAEAHVEEPVLVTPVAAVAGAHLDDSHAFQTSNPNQLMPDMLQSPVLGGEAVSHPPQGASVPRVYGSPRRPMSARLAFRRQERGVSLRGDLYVAPTVMWAQRLGINPRALPLFPDKSKLKVVENPRQKLEEVLCIIVDLLNKHSIVKEATEDSSLASEVEVKKRLPLGLKKFTGRAPVSDDPVETDNDAAGLERKIMDQTRKLSTNLEAVWKSTTLGLKWEALSSKPKVGIEIKNAQLAQALTRKPELTRAELQKLGVPDLRPSSYIQSEDFRHFRPASDVTLDRSEIETIHYIIKDRIIPILDSRIQQLRRIIEEMRPENIQTTKETPQSLDRDLLSYEAELEKRATARQAITQDLINITHKLIEAKSSRKFDNLNSHAARLRVQREQLETSDKDVAKGRAAEDKTSFVQKVVALMKSKDPKEQKQGIEHVAVEGVKMFKRASAHDSEHMRSLLVGHFFSRHLSVRTVAVPLLSQKQLLFKHIPVEEIPPMPQSNNPDPAVHANYDNKKADNDLLSELFTLAAKSSYDAQETFLQEIYKLVRIQDEKNMHRLYDFLKSPNSNVRVVAMRSLAKHTSGYNSLETAQRVAELQTDPEWSVRSALCEVLPNISGMLFTLVPRPTVEVKDPSSHEVTGKMHFHRLDDKESGENEEMKKEETTQEDIDFEIERKKEIRLKFQAGLRQAEQYARRQKEMIQITMQVLEHLLNDDSYNTRRAAICFYSKVGAPNTMHSASILFKGCKDRSGQVRAAAFRCIPSIINRKVHPEQETVGASIEKKKTIKWLVGQLVAFMDPETALKHWKETMAPAEWKREMSPEFKKEIRGLAVR